MWSIFIKILTKALLSSSLKRVKYASSLFNKFKKFKVTSPDLRKDMFFNWNKEYRLLKKIQDFKESETKLDILKDYAKRKSVNFAKRNLKPSNLDSILYPKRMYDRVSGINDRNLAREQEELRRELLAKEKNCIKQEKIKVARKQKNNKKAMDREDKEFRSFADFFLSLNRKEQNDFHELMKREDPFDVAFNSKWIYFGAFIPNYTLKDNDFTTTCKIIDGQVLTETTTLKYKNTQSTRGTIKLMLSKGSKKNPTGVYNWVNVSYYTWKKIIADPTGKNFWKSFYTKNRKNMKHLTPESIYYKNTKKNTKATKKYNKGKGK